MGTVVRLARAHSRVLGQRVQALARVRPQERRGVPGVGKRPTWRGGGDPPWSSEARGAKPERLRQSGLKSPLR